MSRTIHEAINLLRGGHAVNVYGENITSVEELHTLLTDLPAPELHTAVSLAVWKKGEGESSKEGFKDYDLEKELMDFLHLNLLAIIQTITEIKNGTGSR